MRRLGIKSRLQEGVVRSSVDACSRALRRPLPNIALTSESPEHSVVEPTPHESVRSSFDFVCSVRIGGDGKAAIDRESGGERDKAPPGVPIKNRVRCESQLGHHRFSVDGQRLAPGPRLERTAGRAGAAGAVWGP